MKKKAYDLITQTLLISGLLQSNFWQSVNNYVILGILGCHHGRDQEENGEAVQRDVRGRGQENDAAKDDDGDDNLNWWFVMMIRMVVMFTIVKIVNKIHRMFIL